MTDMSQLPDDIISSVLDWLNIRQLVIASHVCQRWRLFALEHQTFWGLAIIHRELSTSDVDFFLARISRSQVGERPVKVIVNPNRFGALLWSRDQVQTLHDKIIPTVFASLSHITSLTLEVHAALAEPIFAALRQPAPALRVFKFVNRPQQGSLMLPPDIFTGHAPALVELVLGGDMQLPAQPIPGLHAVESFNLHGGPREPELSSIFEWFPNVQRIETHGRRAKLSGSLTPRHLAQLRRLESLGLDVSLLTTMRQYNLSWEHLLRIRRLELQWFAVELTSTAAGLFAFQSPAADDAFPNVLMPRSSQELHFFALRGRTRIVFSSDTGVPFVRTVHGQMSDAGEARIWGAVTAYPALVTLSIDIDALETLRKHSVEFHALEALLVRMTSRLPRFKALARPVPCPCLRTVLFQKRLSAGDPIERAIVTCRGVDEFLRASFAVGDWAALDVVLVDMILYGAAQIDDARIACVRALSRQECAGLGPRVATLLGDADM